MAFTAWLTMTSREIEELTGKEHQNVLRDIRAMLSALGIDPLSFEAMSPDAYGRPQPVFNLPKDLTITLVSGYSVEMRYAIVKRWQELEGQAAGLVIPQTLPDALRLTADLAVMRKALLGRSRGLAVA